MKFYIEKGKIMILREKKIWMLLNIEIWVKKHLDKKINKAIIFHVERLT